MKREANTKPTTTPKPTHGAGEKFSIGKIVKRSDNATRIAIRGDGNMNVKMSGKTFGEIGRGTSNIVQSGAIVPFLSTSGATEAMYFINRHILDKIDFLLSDLDRFTMREPRSKQDAIYMRGMFRGAFRNDLMSLRDMLSRTDVCVSQVMIDDISARMKRNAETHGIIETNKEV